MNLALNNLQRLICHKTQQNKPNLIETIQLLVIDRNTLNHSNVWKLFSLDMTEYRKYLWNNYIKNINMNVQWMQFPYL